MHLKYLHTIQCFISYFRLIVSLCASDMLVSLGILSYVAHQESSSVFTLSSSPSETCITLILKSIRITSHVITLLNLLGLAFDHYIAIVKPLDYPSLMNRKRANILIITFWIVAFILGFSDFYIPEPIFSYCDRQAFVNYCEAVFCSMYNGEYVIFVMALICFIAMSVIYTTIYIQLHQYHKMQQEIRRQVKRNKRGLVTTLIILFVFCICWLPYCLFEITMIISIQFSTDFFKQLKYFKLMNQISLYLYDVLLMNSVLDAVIYSLRMKEVQQGYRNIVKKCPRRKTTYKEHLQLTTDRSTGRTCTYATLLTNSHQDSTSL